MAQIKLSTEKKIIHLEDRFVVAKGEGEGVGWTGNLGLIDANCLPLEWISNDSLLYSTGNHIYSLVMEHDNVRTRMYICICDWVTLLYSRKLTEHCKPSMMEKK